MITASKEFASEDVSKKWCFSYTKRLDGDSDDDDDDSNDGGLNVSQSSIDYPIYPHFEPCLYH